jgi:hypothetical protein
MSAYTLLRLVHGYWRWMALVSALVVLVRATVGAHTGSEWTRGRACDAWFPGGGNLQVMMGRILYFAFSPFWLATYQSFHETMSSPVARFFGVEHESAMLALIATHVGRVRAERAFAASTSTASPEQPC